MADAVAFGDKLMEGIDAIMGNQVDPFEILGELAGCGPSGPIGFLFSHDDEPPTIGERVARRAGDMMLGAYLAGWRPEPSESEE